MNETSRERKSEVLTASESAESTEEDEVTGVGREKSEVETHRLTVHSSYLFPVPLKTGCQVGLGSIWFDHSHPSQLVA